MYVLMVQILVLLSTFGKHFSGERKLFSSFIQHRGLPVYLQDPIRQSVIRGLRLASHLSFEEQFLELSFWLKCKMRKDC